MAPTARFWPQRIPHGRYSKPLRTDRRRSRISGRSRSRPRVQDYARVVMHTSYLSDEALATAHLEQTDDISRTVREALAAAGPGAKVCVLPEGPQTIPYLLDHREI